MTGPLTKAVGEYLSGGFSRFHTPGHKGENLFPQGFDWGELWQWDVTECAGLDSLFHADGPIRETEQAYSRLYRTTDSFISAGGSTLCIQAMLALALQPGEHLLAVRGVHTSAVNAMALLDLHPHWLLPTLDSSTGLAGAVEPEEVEKALAQHPEARALYLTSPTYFGAISDISALSAICHRRGIPLLADNAHGAHLAFGNESIHPIALGADLCCDSLHKTLPVLTGGAMLQVGNPVYAPKAKEKMALFGSTSPNYPVMLSIDATLGYLQSDMASDYLRICQAITDAATFARQKGMLLPQFPWQDPWRLTFSGAPLGLDGPALATHLRHWQIEPELVSEAFCVLMAGPGNSSEDFSRLRQALEVLPAGEPLALAFSGFSLPRQRVSLREAMFADALTLPIEEATGRVAASMVSPCPPGIPLVVPGEEIDGKTAALLKSYGIFAVNVIN